MFLWSGGGTKTKYAIFGKNVRSPRTLFFLENTASLFGVKRRTNERSERNCEAEVERLEGGRAEQSQGRQSRCRNRAKRAKGGGRRAERDDRARGERAKRASIYRQSQAASNSAEEKCSLFVVSSPFWGAAMHPIGEETEKRRNGTEAAQLFVCHLFTNTGTISNSLSSVKTTPVILNGSHFATQQPSNDNPIINNNQE